VTNYSYDAGDRPTGLTNGWGESCSYSYDGLDRLVGVSEPNGVTGSLAYDAAGRLTSLAYRDGANRTLVERSYTYDAVGNRLSEADENGQTTNYAYDAVDRLIGSADPVQGVVEYSFDAAGNRLTRSDAWGVTAYAYNANNRRVWGYNSRAGGDAEPLQLRGRVRRGGARRTRPAVHAAVVLRPCSGPVHHGGPDPGRAELACVLRE